MAKFGEKLGSNLRNLMRVLSLPFRGITRFLKPKRKENRLLSALKFLPKLTIAIPAYLLSAALVPIALLIGVVWATIVAAKRSRAHGTLKHTEKFHDHSPSTEASDHSSSQASVLAPPSASFIPNSILTDTSLGLAAGVFAPSFPEPAVSPQPVPALDAQRAMPNANSEYRKKKEK